MTTETVAALGNTPAAPSNPAGKRSDTTEIPGRVPRDRWGRPLIAVLDEAGCPTPNPTPGSVDRNDTPIPWVSVAYTRASTLGGVLEHQGGLAEWKARMAMLGLARRRDLAALVLAVESPNSPAGKKELGTLYKRALEAAESNAAADLGTAFHAFAQRRNENRVVPDLGPDQPMMDAYAAIVDQFEIHGVEQFVVCHDLLTAGTYDIRASPRGFLVAPDGAVIGPDDVIVIDIKTSRTDDYFGVKFAVQQCVYGLGEAYDPATGLRTPLGTRTDWALILHVPSGGTTATLHWVDLRAGLEVARLANRVLNIRKRRDLVTAAAAPNEVPVYATAEEASVAAGLVPDRTAEQQAAALVELRSADTTGDIDAVRARVGDSWSPELEEVANTRVGRLAIRSGAVVVPPVAPDLGPSLQRRQLLRAIGEAITRGQLAQIHGRAGPLWDDECTAAAHDRMGQILVVEALRAASTTDELVELYRRGSAAGAWTGEMTREAGLRAAELRGAS